MSRSLRVLVCDDTRQVRTLIKSELSLEDDIVVVGEAANGVEAIDLAAAEQPDVVLLDIGMPVMDGLEALPRIRAVAPSARVVVLSAFDAAEMRDKACSAGAFTYIEKGAPAQQVIAAVRGGLDRTAEQTRGGLDRTAEQTRGGLDRTAEQTRGGLDRTAEQTRGGLGRTAEQTPAD